MREARLWPIVAFWMVTDAVRTHVLNLVLVPAIYHHGA
jgi:hypothetical protein